MTMKTTTNHRKEIIKSGIIASSIKLDSDFNKSMEIIGKYPVLVQVIKLSNIIYNWFDEMYSKTNDKEFLTMKEDFDNTMSHNLDVYMDTENEMDWIPMVQEMKDSLSQMFSK